MTAPIATFGRGGTRVSLHDAIAVRLAFRRRDDAEAYLRTWKDDDGAMASLRYALRRCERGATVATMSDEDVIRGVAQHLLNGSLVLTESAPPVPVATSFPVVSTSTSPAAAAAAALAAKLPAALAKRPLIAALLPLLEQTQIEGAKVLPEVLQALAQLQATMATINVATVSLEPAPSGVPDIGTEIKNASGSITSTLDAL